MTRFTDVAASKVSISKFSGRDFGGNARLPRGEGPSKRDPTMTSGRTRHNKLVHFAAQGADGARKALPAGTFADVRITSAAPHFLRGELVEVTAPPRHRTRIPVTAG